MQKCSTERVDHLENSAFWRFSWRSGGRLAIWHDTRHYTRDLAAAKARATAGNGAQGRGGTLEATSRSHDWSTAGAQKEGIGVACTAGEKQRKEGSGIHL